MDSKMLMKLKEMAEAGLADIVRKGQFSAAELQNAKNALCLLKCVDELEDGGNSGRMYGRSYDEGGSYRRGRGHNGRYVSRDSGYGGMAGRGSYEDDNSYDGSYDGGMSGHSTKDRMIAILEEAEHNGGRIDQREAKELLARMV